MRSANPGETEDQRIRRILERARSIAVVGASPDPRRPSHRVMAFLHAAGYRLIPVNPQSLGNVLFGEPCVASLESIASPVDLVDVFRASAAVPEIVESAIRIGAPALWLQIGVRHEAAAARAAAAGLDVIMDRCPAIEMPRLGIAGPRPAIIEPPRAP
ncbi:MAG: CoA-binding protein [Gammaproteobacteria bacterium]|nr:CoA-binding protein [Gammaproteobacteria bacterium]